MKGLVDGRDGSGKTNVGFLNERDLKSEGTKQNCDKQRVLTCSVFVSMAPIILLIFSMIHRRPCSRNMNRLLSTDSKAYSKTLLLPKTYFPQWVDPQKSEKPFRDRTTGSLYKRQVSNESLLVPQPQRCSWCLQEKNTSRPLYVLHDGPALRERTFAHGYVKSIHPLSRETHFLFVQDMPSIKFLKDIINRFQLLQGKRIKCSLPVVFFI